MNVAVLVERTSLLLEPRSCQSDVFSLVVFDEASMGGASTMTPMPLYNAARDANEPEIVRELRAIGAHVWRKLDVDLIVAFREQWILAEIKLPPGPRGGTKDRHLTPNEIAVRDCPNRGVFEVWTSGQQAVARLMQLPVGR